MTALECWRRGYDVRIIERSKDVVTTGDSFTIGYTAVHAFQNWPFMEEENERIAYSPLVAYCKENGEVFAGPMDFKEILSDNVTNAKAKQRIYRHSRPKFHQMLYEQLSKIGVEVEFDQEVVDYFDDEERQRAGVVLKDGSRQEADLVVAADGARGTSWSLVAGHPVPARSSGDAMFRVAFPVEHVLSDPDITERFKFDESGRSIVNLIFGSVPHADHQTGSETNVLAQGGLPCGFLAKRR
jgi:2-polyprenyl-6-methoxyphenol hydroxylase-like FAD-dependent oxidoreductase